jgi:multidrug efflux system membrane fusion protein
MMLPLPSSNPLSRFFSALPARPVLMLLCCLFFLLPGCSSNPNGDGKKGQKRKSTIPVTIETSQKKILPLEIGSTGYVESFATVAVQSQVTGTLKSVHFKEGDEVNAGDLLFTIDPRPFAANLAKAEALFAKDKAELDNAHREANRYALALQKGAVSAEQSDQATTKVATLTATVKADQAAVDAARLELEYCSIRSPLAGRTGEIKTDPGNQIKANADSPMVIIKQIKPVLAAFTVPGQHLADISKYRAAGTLKVLMPDKNVKGESLTGLLSFIDNTMDPTTGVIRLKATFANADKTLWPGQMIDVRIQLTTRPDCIVVPSQAIQTGQKGPYLYVVKDDQTVEYRPVTPGMLYQGETLIEAGLQAGERVVTDGQMQLADGVKVAERKGSSQSKTDDSDKAAESGTSSARGRQ